MRYLNLRGFIFLFVLSFAVMSFSLISSAEEEVHQEDIITGNVICLIPNYAEGSVKPVIASGPCNGPASNPVLIPCATNDFKAACP